MKRGLLIFLLAVLAGIVGYVVTRQQGCCTLRGSAARHEEGNLLPELEWLRQELKLTDGQFAQARALHLAYRPTCDALCRQVAASRQKVLELAAKANTPSASPALGAALEEQARVQVECQKAMLKHLHETAAVMTPGQARLYLDAMLPQILGAEAPHHAAGH